VLHQPDLAKDAGFSSSPARLKNGPAMHAEIDKVFSTLRTEEVIERLEAADIANARLNDMTQFWQHPQLAARGRWAKVGSPAGELDMLKPPFNLSGFEPRLDPVPALGAHSHAILSELGYGEREVDALAAAKVI
jgi:itaconate CoA-transferase